MSIWWRTKSKDGRVHYVAIDVCYLGAIALLGIVAVLVLPAILTALPQTLLVSAWSLAVGLLCFLVAKLSVVHSGRLVSFGSAQMTPQMRLCYRIGYALMSLGAIFGLLAYWITHMV